MKVVEGKTGGSGFVTTESGLVDIEARLRFLTEAVFSMAEGFDSAQVDQKTLFGLHRSLADLEKIVAETRAEYEKEWDRRKAGKAA
ncbi:MAG: hypothetical protein ACOY3O_13050 [Thermodesulfobacteriota bacterium]